MLRLTCEIRIGQHRFNEVNEVKVKRSIYSFVDTANIRIPTSAILFKAGELNTLSILRPGENDMDSETKGAARRVQEKTASFFNVGDHVEIWLGYNGELNLEFEGFVSKINYTTPCEIECEGYSWQLRNKVITKEFPDLETVQTQRAKDPDNKKPAQTSVREILNYIKQGTDIELSDNIPDVPLAKMNFDGDTGPEALEKLKNAAYLTIYFNGPELYAGLAHMEVGKAAVRKDDRTWTGKRFELLTYKDVNDAAEFHIGWNLVSTDQLRFRKAVDAPLRVKVVHFTSRNEAKSEIAGVKGDIRTFLVPNVGTPEELKKAALAKLAKLSYDGYEGKVTAFLEPFVLPGFKVSVTDENYVDRDGLYLVDSTEVTFGTGGARRICGIGVKINKKDEQATGTIDTGTKKS